MSHTIPHTTPHTMPHGMTIAIMIAFIKHICTHRSCFVVSWLLYNYNYISIVTYKGYLRGQ